MLVPVIRVKAFECFGWTNLLEESLSCVGEEEHPEQEDAGYGNANVVDRSTDPGLSNKWDALAHTDLPTKVVGWVEWLHSQAEGVHRASNYYRGSGINTEKGLGENIFK